MTKYFSGIAEYEIHFKAPSDFLKTEDVVYLEFEKIGCIAEITINGKNYGNIWYPDAKLNVSNILKGENTMIIRVVNEYRNRIIGDLNENSKLTHFWTTGNIESFLNKDSELKQAGLIGKMLLIKQKEIGLK